VSYKATAWAYDLPLIGPQKFVLVALADMADEEHSCYPGQRRLSTMTGFSVRTVQRALEQLEAHGLITREHRQGSRGFRTSDRYRLSVGTAALNFQHDTEPTWQSALMAESPIQRDSVSNPTRHSVRAIEPSVKPSEEPSGGHPPKPFCGKHPEGTDKPCKGCGDARRRYDTYVPEPAKVHIPPKRDITPAECDHKVMAGFCVHCGTEEEAIAS